MGSNQLLNTQKCSSNSSLSSETQRSSSKAHNSLLKILRIISSAVPPQESESGSKGFAIDLNIGFIEESASPIDASTADPFAADNGGVYGGECDRREAEEIIENLELESNGICETKEEGQDEIGEMEKRQGGGGFMGLLIEAATLIFGEFKDEGYKFECKEPGEKEILKSESREDDNDNKNASPKQQDKRRKEDDSYPVVRSKRGRIQVLPNRYKDSIIEPLTPLPRIRSTPCAHNRRRSSK